MAYNYEYPYTDPNRYNSDWILNRVKELSLEWIETRKEWNNTREEFASLKEFLQNYFAQLDLQDEVNAKLDIMARDGSLSALISPLFSEYEKEIDSSISEQNDKISEQNDKINVLNSRMDTFTSLPDGSTAGDAELQDIRIGYNGKVYPSAGDAVRMQVSQLSSDLNELTSSLYTKKVTTFLQAKTNNYYDFVKGKNYKINIKSSTATKVQVGTIANIGDSDFIDSTEMLSGSPINYDFIFRASANASILYVYREPQTANTLVDITIEEVGERAFATKEEVKALSNTNNACSIYEFLGTKDNVISANSWTQEKGYISLTHSGDYFKDGAVALKYSTAFDRVVTYDFVPYENCLLCGYTQTAGLEFFWKQGYCVSVDFAGKKLSIHNKYGNDGETISSALPSIYKSVQFTENNYIGVKHRLTIERTEDRGLKATLYSLKDFSVLAIITVGFEALTVPAIGLGYDYPAFGVLVGKADLYYLGIKVKNASNCHLYIVGDSITEGVAILPSKAWAYMVANTCPNTVVAGRGGATINSMVKRLNDEAKPLNPKYVMVMIGTNAGNTTEKLQEVVETIREMGAIPIINCVPCTSTSIQADINADILALDTPHVRMDIATALNYNLDSGPDSGLYLEDGVHPNESGYERMYKRVLIDCPFLFN